MAHQLFIRYPQQAEGGLSKRKSALVSRVSLARNAAALDLGAHLYLGVGEEASGGRKRQSLLANVFEAVIGAIYLDGGYQAAARFIRRFCMSDESPADIDWKSRLQELIQRSHRVTPTYHLANAAGPDHDRTFQIVVHLGRKVLGKGTGKSKKEAEQAAAAAALKKMGNK